MEKVIVVVGEQKVVVQRLKALAEQEGVSLSDIVRRAIRQYLASINGVPVGRAREE